MLDLTLESGITLSDYPYEVDIINRLLLAHLNTYEHEVLEGLLYEPSRFSFLAFTDTLELPKEDLMPVLEVLASTGVLVIDGDSVCVCKEKRRYLEVQLSRFQKSFTPSLDFFQNLLKCIPIDLLPGWYQIPKTSNNIFDSIVEKHFLTPQNFQRQISEIKRQKPLLGRIIDEVYNSEELSVPSHLLRQKLEMTKEQFMECMLLLELHFACCLTYQEKEGTWVEFVVPFDEWKDYLLFSRQTLSSTEEENIIPYRPTEYGFLEDLHQFLLLLKETPFPLEGILTENAVNTEIPLKESVHLELEKAWKPFTQVKEEEKRLYRVQMAALSVRLELTSLDLSEGILEITPFGKDWLMRGAEERAFFLYKHPIEKEHFLRSSSYSIRHLHAIEKNIEKLLPLEWVEFTSFIEQFTTSLTENGDMSLLKQQNSWSYERPQYSSQDLSFIESLFFKRLFEAGIVQWGASGEKRFLRATSLAKKIF